jgi:hypothetical protein
VTDFYDPALLHLTETAIERLRGRLETRAPTLYGHVTRWMTSLSAGAPADRYFTHPDAFPMLLLPWWLELSVRGAVDREFHGDLVYSTVSGYYFVRLVDDAMDADPPPSAVLPALIYLHTEFQATHHRWFPADHAFWADFLDASYDAAETASVDAGAAEIGRDEFLRVSSRKVAGARVPIAAVCHRHGRPELVAPWTRLVEALGRWHQMRNDVLDWRRDLDRAGSTYFLAEAARRADPGGPMESWILTEGLAWSMRELDAWMDEAQVVAGALASPELQAYLEARRRRLQAEWRTLRDSLAALDQLSATLSASQRSASATDQPLRRA